MVTSYTSETTGASTPVDEESGASSTPVAQPLFEKRRELFMAAATPSKKVKGCTSYENSSHTFTEVEETDATNPKEHAAIFGDNEFETEVVGTFMLILVVNATLCRMSSDCSSDAPCTTIYIHMTPSTTSATSGQSCISAAILYTTCGERDLSKSSSLRSPLRLMLLFIYISPSHRKSANIFLKRCCRHLIRINLRSPHRRRRLRAHCCCPGPQRSSWEIFEQCRHNHLVANKRESFW